MQITMLEVWQGRVICICICMYLHLLCGIRFIGLGILPAFGALTQVAKLYSQTCAGQGTCASICS